MNSRQISKQRETNKNENKEETGCCCYCCYCYNSKSKDSRCCGACYWCCPVKEEEKPCILCVNNFSEYWDSCYLQTFSGYGGRQGAIDEKNGCFCWVCFPIKFPLFFPCFLGSLFNGCINCMRDTNTNYLF